MKFEVVFNIIKYISALSVIFPLLACVIKFKTLDLALRVLLLYIIISSLAEIISYCFIINNIYNYAIRNLYTVLEFSCLATIYYLKFRSRNARNLIVVFYVMFLILAAIVFLQLEKFNKQDNLLSTIESGFFIFLGYTYIYELMLDIANYRFSENYFVWVNHAILIYFSLTFVLFLFVGYIEKFRIEGYYYVYSLHLIANILLNALMTKGIWKKN